MHDISLPSSQVELLNTPPLVLTFMWRASGARYQPKGGAERRHSMNGSRCVNISTPYLSPFETQRGFKNPAAFVSQIKHSVHSLRWRSSKFSLYLCRCQACINWDWKRARIYFGQGPSPSWPHTPHSLLFWDPGLRTGPWAIWRYGWYGDMGHWR